MRSAPDELAEIIFGIDGSVAQVFHLRSKLPPSLGFGGFDVALAKSNRRTAVAGGG